MKPIYTKNRTIGLLGGSFNPAHGGHLHITLFGLRSLKMDEVWWLVSPGNPLKSQTGMASYGQRLASAETVAKPYKHIRVLDIEKQFNTRFTYETIALLKSRNPGTRFVWMMGADNLAQFHRWKRWQQLLIDVPVVVFDRAPYSHRALRSKTMLRSLKFLLKNNSIGAFRQAPSLTFIHLKRDPLSSTALRKKLGGKAFLGHNEDAVKN